MFKLQFMLFLDLRFLYFQSDEVCYNQSMLVQDVLFQEFDTTLISGAGISVFSNVLQCFGCLCNFEWGCLKTGGLGFSSSIWSVITTLLCGCFFFLTKAYKF